MTKDLIATFGKSDGGTHNWKYRDLDPNLTAPQIIFSNNGFIKVR
jgi:hypothetical protein